MKPHQGEEVETPSAETPGAADTGAGEPRGAETAGSTRPVSKIKTKKQKNTQSAKLHGQNHQL